MADSVLAPSWRDVFKSRTGVFPETLGITTEAAAQAHLLNVGSKGKSAPASALLSPDSNGVSV